jgi:hypothetical protein
VDNRPRVVIPELRQALLELVSEADPDPMHLVGNPGDHFEIGSGSYLGADVFRHLGWLVEDQLVRASCDDLGLGRRRWLVHGLTAVRRPSG